MLNLVVRKETAGPWKTVSRTSCWVLVFYRVRSGRLLVRLWTNDGLHVHDKCLQYVGTHLLEYTASQNEVVSYCYCLLHIQFDHSAAWSVDWLHGTSLIVTAIVTFPNFQDNPNFIIVFTKARHLSWPRIIQSRLSNPLYLTLRLLMSYIYIYIYIYMGSNPTGGMDICLLWVSCVVR